MNDARSVARPPSKPILIFDGDCRFCSLWIKRWQQATGDRVDYVPFQDPSVAERFPEIPRAHFESAVQLIETDGRVYSAAEAAFRAMATNPDRSRSLRRYQQSRLFATMAEWGYHFVAGHRRLFSALTWLGFGEHVERPAHSLVRWVFLRGMGLIYLVAFLSLWSQIQGLVGSNGIWPAQQTMQVVDQKATAMRLGLDRYRMMPTLCWISASDGYLNFLCVTGLVLAVLLMAGVAPMPSAALLWLIYLSLVRVCRLFLEYQWDNLLLEAGFLTIFFAPLQLLPRPSRERPPSRIVLWLLRWMVFRLMFESGYVKLWSGDELWHNLTALTVHYETQPLPTWIGWWAHQLPLWFQKLSCLLMFGIELVVPFLFFAPRRLRIVGAGATVFLQILILLTGNYTFFNWLTILLCVPLLDDFTLLKRAPERLRRTFATQAADGGSSSPLHWRRLATIPLAALVLTVTFLEFVALFGGNTARFFPVTYTYFMVSPFRSINRYGLFAVMTRARPEIIVEGSNDGEKWLPYEFKYKAGALNHRPSFVAPFQPRLDWQMWFAALGSVQGNPWFVNFCARLLQGSPEVLALIKDNPFPDKPPKFIHAELYEYHFTNREERKRTGNWWRRELKGEYMAPISLSNAH